RRARLDLPAARLPAPEGTAEVYRLGGVALPCHPGRPTVGMCAHYETRGPLDGVIAVEALNGGSKKGEDERVRELMRRYGYAGFGGGGPPPAGFLGPLCPPVRRRATAMDGQGG